MEGFSAPGNKQQRSRRVTEFGDFQTPLALALAATKLLHRLGIQPRSILEPTCGRGAFVAAAVTIFPNAESIVGIHINSEHLGAAKIAAYRPECPVELRQGDFSNTTGRVWSSPLKARG